MTNPEKLGEFDPAPHYEVLKQGLCQVCGIDVGDDAFAVCNVFKGEMHPRVVQGFMHEPCLRLALRFCPELRRWNNRLLFRIDPREIPADRKIDYPYVPVAWRDRALDVRQFRSD